MAATERLRIGTTCRAIVKDNELGAGFGTEEIAIAHRLDRAIRR